MRGAWKGHVRGEARVIARSRRASQTAAAGASIRGQTMEFRNLDTLRKPLPQEDVLPSMGRRGKALPSRLWKTRRSSTGARKDRCYRGRQACRGQIAGPQVRHRLLRSGARWYPRDPANCCRRCRGHTVFIQGLNPCRELLHPLHERRGPPRLDRLWSRSQAPPRQLRRPHAQSNNLVRHQCLQTDFLESRTVAVRPK